MVDLTRVETLSKIVAAFGSLAIPVAIFLGTQAVNRADREAKAREQCRAEALQILDDADKLLAGGQGGDPATTVPKGDSEARNALDTRTQKIDVAAKYLLETCDAAGVPVPLNLQRTLTALSETVPDATVMASLQETARRIGAQSDRSAAAAEPTTKPQPGSISTPIAPSTPVPPIRPAQLRLFIHISDEAQRDAAKRFAAAIAERQVDGIAITVPGIELVAPQPASSFRCLKKPDCARGQAMLTQISAILAGPVPRLQDLSAKYDARSDIRIGTYELWFGPDDILLRS